MIEGEIGEFSSFLTLKPYKTRRGRTLREDREERSGALSVLEFLRDDRTDESRAGTVFDIGIHHAADEAGITFKDDDAIATGATGELNGSVGIAIVVMIVIGGLSFGLFPGSFFLGSFTEAFDEDFLLSAYEGDVVLFTDLILEIEHFIVAAAFDVFRDVVGVEIVGPGAGAGAVFEDEAIFETALADEIHALLEGVFGFATEANDEIAGDGAIGDCLANPLEHFAVLFDGIAAFHPLEDVVAT